MPKHAKRTKRTRDEGLMAGLRKHAASFEGAAFHPNVRSVEALVALVQEHLDAMAAVQAAESAWRGALRREARLETALKKLLLHANLVIFGVFGEGSPKLLDFGLKPRRPTKPSAATTALAVMKRAATRKARGTMGKKQRLKIKGTP